MKRQLFKVLVIALASATLLTLLVGVVLAATTMTSTRGDYYDGGAYGHTNTGNPAGRYRFYMGHWNPASNGLMGVNVKNLTTENAGFKVISFTNVLTSGGVIDFTRSASVYDTQRSMWSNQEGEDQTDSGRFHAPAAYPSLYKGCHWADCSVGDGGPFPIQLNQLTSIPSTWQIAIESGSPAATTGVWNASYDIWLDTNARGFLPGNPKGLVWTADNPQGGQNDGAEIMIWLNNRGYNNTPITPAGSQIGTATIAGEAYDVWFGRLGTAPNPQWNVVSYVKVNRTTQMTNLDTKLFIQDATGRTCSGAPDNVCVSDTWWVTSIQSGFEIWADGQGLETVSFEVTPQVASTTQARVPTGRTNDAGTSLVHWENPFTIRKSGCAGGTATYEISEVGDDTNPSPINPPVTGTMTEVQPGEYFAIVNPLTPRHGNATVKMTIVCPSGGGTQEDTINIYIDPSGVVRTPQGNGIPHATVTLLRSNSPSGPFVTVPNSSTIMAPYNRRNPDLTGEMGDFGWDVTAGYYKVRAQKAGCVSAANPSQPYVETAVLTIPPAITNLDLRLNCASGSGSGVTVKLTTITDWGTGYCDNVIVTNNTSAPVTWNVSFTFPGGTIYNAWNFVYTRSGNQLTNAHGVGWNNVLQPGQSTHSIGFCANR